METMKEKLLDLALEYAPKLVTAVIMLVVGFTVVNMMINMLDKSLKKGRIDISLHSFIKSVISFVLKIIVVITAAMILGVPMTTFIAMLSAAGLAVGLALKDSLSNFAGGILILIFRPFNVGDFIETQGYSGTVKEIQLLYTSLNTTDNRRVMIPNGELSNAKIVNFSSEETRRLDLIFNVSYKNDIQKVKRVLESIVDSHELIFKEPEPVIRVKGYRDIGVDFAVLVWCKREDYWSIHYDLHEQVKTAFDKEGIVIPILRREININTVQNK